MMNPRTGELPRRSRTFQEGGTNWIVVAGGAVLSMLSVGLGYKLKQFLCSKDGKSGDMKKLGSCHLHSYGCCNCYNESRNVVEVKQQCDGRMVTEPEMAIPLVTVPTPEFNKENNMMWSSSTDRLELPRKLFHLNSFKSPHVSESGSGIFSKQGVIQKLRQQLKRRDDVILEMQDKISELKNSVSSQLSHSSLLQSMMDAANGDLIDSEMEIQRLRKAIADHCVGHINYGKKSTGFPVWQAEKQNSLANGHPEVRNKLNSKEKSREGVERIEILESEVNELKELIKGKDFLLQSYREQKSELSVKIKELQQRLDSQFPNIL